MISRLPKKKVQIRVDNEQEIIPQQEILEEQEPQDLSFIPKMLKKESLFVSFSGTLKSGFCPEDDSLTAFGSIVYGQDWERVAGQKNFISQIASSNGKEIVWDIPFQISFETTYLCGWPQLVIALYGTDFLGRSFVRGYGNMHLPSQSGKQKRKIQIFKPLPQSTISGIFGYFGGVQAEYKDYQKILSMGDGREVTRVKTMGWLNVEVETLKHNFKKYGYE